MCGSTAWIAAAIASRSGRTLYRQYPSTSVTAFADSRQMIRRIATFASIALAACGRSLSDAGSTTVDSAGVTIVTNAAPIWRAGEEWRIDTIPLVDVGGVDSIPATIFADVGGAALLPDGGFVIAEGSDATLRFFDAAGKHRASVGRKGQGPGEYEDFGGIIVDDDTLFVWDGDLDRLTVLDVAGKYVRSATIRLTSGRYVFAGIGRRWADGSFLIASSDGVGSNDPMGIVAESVTVVRLFPDLQHDSVIGRWPRTEMMKVGAERFFTALTVPYARQGVHAWADSGVWIGTGDAPRLDLHDLHGRLLRSVRWNAAPVPVGAGELDAWRAKQTARTAGGAPSEISTAFAAGYAKARFPETRPPYRALLRSDDGHLLVARVPRWDATDADPREWDVIDADGRWLGPIVMPPRASPTELRGDRLLARWRDDDDVVHMRLYRVDRR
jgi:hypothetical protein